MATKDCPFRVKTKKYYYENTAISSRVARVEYIPRNCVRNDCMAWRRPTDGTEAYCKLIGKWEEE